MVFTPSATDCMPVSISSRARPRPSSRPTCQFRLRPPVHVSTRSPRPLRPARVSRRPPRAHANREISARPRVMRAARALGPSPRPSTTPAAMAITFFIAPPTSTPMTSSLAYSLKYEPARNSCCTVRTASRHRPATDTAVGAAPRDLRRERRTGEHHHRARRAQLLLDHLRHAIQRSDLESLGRVHDRRFGTDHRLGAAQQRPGAVGRHRQHDRFRPVERLFEGRRRRDRRRQSGSRQIRPIDAIPPQPLHELGTASPQPRPLPHPREMNRQRRAPGAGPQNGHVVHRFTRVATAITRIHCTRSRAGAPP